MWTKITVWLCLISPPYARYYARHELQTKDHWSYLQKVAWDYQLTGPSCPWNDDYDYEIVWVRKGLLEARYYPTLDDCERLPKYKPEDLMTRFYWNREAYLHKQKVIHLQYRQEIEEEIEIAEKRRIIAHIIRHASDEKNHWLARRKSLNHLRKLLGPEMYYSGRWFDR